MSSLRSKTVCRLNVQYLAQFNGAKCCSFWTFTLPEVISPIEAAARWRYLSKDLVRHLGFKGVRVFELHPNGHGLHVHAVAVGYYPIRDVLQLCKAHGWGRVGVERVHSLDSEKIGLYLGKYLVKCKRLWNGISLKGLRWWATFGKIKDKVRLSDITIDSPISRIYRGLSVSHVLAVFPWLKRDNRRLVSFWRYKLACRLYVGDDLGDWDSWVERDMTLRFLRSWSDVASLGGVA